MRNTDNRINNSINNRAKEEKVLLLLLDSPKISHSPRNEFIALTATLGYKKAAVLSLRLRQPQAEYLLGEGQVQRLKDLVTEQHIGKILVNTDLSGGHQRNLQRALSVELVDRTGLILEIFAQNARSHQSKLQVKLAQLHYQSTHLVRGWSHLERQRGAIGQRGGPGEKQLETDRRLLRRDIGRLNAKLKKISKQRQLAQRVRKQSLRPLIALVGYTNAGKSSLFNKMTKADALASPKLFATLDPTIRRMRADLGYFLVTDTVGFIDNLSPLLLEAFAATLDEIRHADVIMHVTDVTDPDSSAKEEAVATMLRYLQVETIPCLKVHNKIDKIDEDNSATVVYDSEKRPASARISAATGQGVGVLGDLAQQLMAKPKHRDHHYVPRADARLSS